MLSSSSKLDDIAIELRTLSENPESHQLVDNAQDDEEIYGLLEDLRAAINDYKVGSRRSSPLDVDKPRTIDGTTIGGARSEMRANGEYSPFISKPIK